MTYTDNESNTVELRTFNHGEYFGDLDDANSCTWKEGIDSRRTKRILFALGMRCLANRPSAR
jgi:hypothetical protein